MLRQLCKLDSFIGLDTHCKRFFASVPPTVCIGRFSGATRHRSRFMQDYFLPHRRKRKFLQHLWTTHNIFDLLCHRLPLTGFNPDISVTHMWIVLSSLLVQQLCLRLSVEPAYVEGTVAVADNVLCLEATLAEVVANRLGVEARGTLHRAWGDAAHLFMTDCRVKVLLYTLY